MGTDRYAYQSNVRGMDPIAKLFISFVTAVICLLCNGICTGIGTLLMMGTLTILWGGVCPRVFLRFLRIPLAFLILGCVTVMVESYPMDTAVLFGVSVGSSIWGVTTDSLFRGVCIVSKSMGVIASMYFLTLNTPMTDVTFALRRLHIPQLMIELMDLIYRFIFVLSDTASQIRTAQHSRLGYVGFRRSMNSVGTLASMVFLRAWNKGDKIFSALESRGYTGTLLTLSEGYEKGTVCYGIAGIVAVLQLICFFLEVHFL